jgi:hypothetical protein
MRIVLIKWLQNTLIVNPKKNFVGRYEMDYLPEAESEIKNQFFHWFQDAG